MKANLYTILIVVSALAFGACGSTGEPVVDAGPGAGAEDAAQRPLDGGPTDAGRADAGASDAGPDDAGPDDAGPSDAGPDDASLGDAGPGDAGAELDAGPTCAADEHECDGACVPIGRACGVPIPDACTTTADCGAAGECIDARCVCANGYRACVAGCCPVSYRTSTLSADDLVAQAVELAFGADGTAYILVQVEVSTVPDTQHELHLYTRAPALGAPIVRESLSIPVSYQDETFGFGVRSDGTVFVAVAPRSGEGSPVELHRWTSSASSSENIGSAFGYDPGVSLTIDDDDTVWASWSRSRAGGLSAYSLTSGGVARTYSDTVGGTIEQTDVEHDPVSGAVYSFWGHRYTGNFVSGVVTLTEHPNLSPRCPADDAAFDSLGRHWSVYNTYSSIETHLCRDGMTRPSTTAIVRGSLPRAIPRARLAIDGEDAAFVTYYENGTYTVHWIASTDAERWSRGALPVHYGLPSGSTTPAAAFVDVARRPDGPVSFVVVPSDPSMGPMTLVDIE